MVYFVLSPNLFARQKIRPGLYKTSYFFNLHVDKLVHQLPIAKSHRSVIIYLFFIMYWSRIFQSINTCFPFSIWSIIASFCSYLAIPLYKLIYFCSLVTYVHRRHRKNLMLFSIYLFNLQILVGVTFSWSSRKLPLLMLQVTVSLCANSSSTVVMGISIFGKVKKATKLPQYVVATTKTTSHQEPTISRALSAYGRCIPPEKLSYLRLCWFCFIFSSSSDCYCQ